MPVHGTASKLATAVLKAREIMNPIFVSPTLGLTTLAVPRVRVQTCRAGRCRGRAAHSGNVLLSRAFEATFRHRDRLL